MTNRCTCGGDVIRQNSGSAFIDSLVERICDTYDDEKGINHIDGFNLPSEMEIISIVTDLLEIVFPGYTNAKNYSKKLVRYNIGDILSRLYIELYDQIFRSFRYYCASEINCKDCEAGDLARNAVESLLQAIPQIRETMKSDIVAAMEGDPAAKSADEVVLSYPGIKAITIQRFAHELYHQNVPLLPRMMTEYAHAKTGIDIHPGAHLGKGIFIDHGTGVVIGETAKIGHNVKIYQGVTLGALSFPKDSCGKIIKGAKRHPSIEDNVTIYSGATVLGDIVIGEGSIIGGNVWITESVKPKSKITIAAPDLTIRSGQLDA